MRKFLFCITFFSALIGSSTAQAQIMPNADFENWVQNGPFESPSDWAGGPSVAKSTDMHSGAFAIQLQTGIFTNPMTGTTDTIGGRAFTGVQGMGPGAPGISGYAFTARPDSLTGWFKYSNTNPDSFVVHVTLSKWDSTNNLKMIIGETIFMGNAATEYTRFSLPILYNDAATPDSATIELMSSSSHPPMPAVLGSVLLVDDLAFVTKGLGVEAQTKAEMLHCFPNPANQSMVISNIKAEKIYILNISGQVLKTISTQNMKEIMLDVSDFNSGVYFVRADGSATTIVIKH